MAVSMRWNRGAFRRVSAAADAALRAAAAHVEQVSNSRVPDLTGSLQASSRVSVDEGQGRAVISYDDPAAVPQHERLDYHHDDGQAKYLESALASERGEVGRIIAARIRRELRA